MAWSDLTFTGCTVLTAAQMNQLHANFAALAQGAPGAPPLAPNSLMWTGQASGAGLHVSSLARLQALAVTQAASVGRLSLADAAPGLPAPGTLYRHPSPGAAGFAVPMDPGSAAPALAPVLTAAQGGVAAGSLEDWHAVGSAGEPGFQNGWVNYGAGEPGAAFRKLPDGTVRIRGIIKNGSTGSLVLVFTLPVGYRPGGRHHQATVVNGGFGYLRISAEGPVELTAGGNAWVELQTSFLAEG